MPLPYLPLLLAIVAPQPVTIDPPPAPILEDSLAAGFDRVDRMTVPVSINGRGPYPFVIDTAADRSVIATSIASVLRLPPARGVTLHSIAGPERVSTVRLDSLLVGTSARAGIIAPVLGRRGLGADGLLGVDALTDQRIILDFAAERMTVAPSSSRRPVDLPGTIVVTARRRFGQLILANASVAGKKVFAVIDTGAENSVANLALQRSLERRGRVRGQPGLLIGVTGRTVAADMAVLPRLVIGGIQVLNVPIAFADIHTFARFGLQKDPAILIGMDVLREFERVTVDFGRKSVRFGPPRAAGSRNRL